MISQRVMRPNDDFFCFELNESHRRELWERLEETEKNTSVFQKDGPAEAPIIFDRVRQRKRPFLAIIDPPYVSEEENGKVLETIEKLHNAQSMSDLEAIKIEIDKLFENLMTFIESKSISALVASLSVGRVGLVGSRVIILNPPCQNLAPRLESALSWLAKTMEEEPGCGKCEVEVLLQKEGPTLKRRSTFQYSSIPAFRNELQFYHQEDPHIAEENTALLLERRTGGLWSST
jgi:23S rRNA A2030 N6-methylase RlmJ